MDTSTDPITMLLTTGGVSGVGGGALTAYIIAKMAGRNGNGNTNNDAQNHINELRIVAEKLDRTNELLTDLIRCQARLEGYIANSQNR